MAQIPIPLGGILDDSEIDNVPIPLAGVWNGEAAAAGEIKTINGVAIANIKTKNGVAAANIKTINGLEF